MALDDADRTEPPTQRRRDEAREEGQIARSVDLTAAAALLAGLLLLKFIGPLMLDRLMALTRSLGDPPPVAAHGLLPWVRLTGRAAADALLPFLALLVVLTAVAAVAQSGLLLTWKKLSPKVERLDPVQGLKRLWSGESVIRLLLGLAKVGLVGWVAWITIKARLGPVLGTGRLPAGGLLAVSLELLFDLALRLGAVLLVLGLIDYFHQRWKLERQLRMTRQEVRDELRKMEGDPLVKQRRRQIQRRLAMQRIHAEVPRADVVVTNPTHYAVALRYVANEMRAPRVTAKGRDQLAERIRHLALQHGVPLVQRPPLARALYAGVEVGQEIPPQFYRAVAEVLAYVYQLSGRKAG